jgi:hypothetical protein
MNTIMRTILVSALTCALGSGVALAGKPSKPPADSGRDVIADAAAICATFPADLRDAACAIVYQSNGGTIFGGRCDGGDGLIPGDNGYVDYAGRNCEKNEAALVRKASSAVLSLDDLIERDKQDQAASAAGYLCTYEDDYNTLLAIGKLVAEAGVDLGADASDLADEIMDTVGYCDSL